MRKGKKATVVGGCGDGGYMYRLATIAFVIGALLVSPALADALVEVKSNDVLVNHDGKGYRQVTGITPVEPGDLVYARAESGHGWILYPDCDVEVLPGRVYTVEDRPGEIPDPKAFRPECKKPVAWWLLAVPPIIACAAFCFDDDDKGASP
jgi:hypothetical protein